MKSKRTQPRQSDGRKFSVVVPIYNVEKYLLDLLRSLTTQSLDFKSHIEVVIIDDGSTDRSAQIAKRWQRRYPDNIRYIRKSNGGAASARNAGLAIASHEWVAFIDADDFVDRDYFKLADECLQRHGDLGLALLSANLVVFDEKTGSERDQHPLRYRYAGPEKVLPADDRGRFIQPGVIGTFLRKSLIREWQLTFDERIRPNFEDADFVGRYLLRAADAPIVFLPQARYLYRHRADHSSLRDSTTTDPAWYGDKLEYGLLGLLDDALGLRGIVPQQVQDMVLYDLSWQFLHLVNRSERVAFLTDEQRQKFRRLLSQIFLKIDVDTIASYDIWGLPTAHRVGILNVFKNARMPVEIAEVTGFESARRLVKVVYWSPDPEPSIQFDLDGRAIKPVYHKTRRHEFLDALFAWEHISWVAVADGRSLAVRIGGKPALIDVKARRRMRVASVADIPSAFIMSPPLHFGLPEHVRNLRAAARQDRFAAKYREAWVFMDRDAIAEDSAEVLFRYVRRHRPEINAFFVLKRGSPDWVRLKREGFRLLGFNEPEHAVALLNAKYLISSQADHYVIGYLPQHLFGDLMRYRFVFLQHGVIKDDISRWLNGLDIDCLVTSTAAEQRSITDDSSPYKFSTREVVLTGLPRHDELLSAAASDGRLIVIMPTWRAWLTGNAMTAGNARSVNRGFAASQFLQRWKGLLHAPRLAVWAARQGYRVVFVPHPNLEQYLDLFELPPAVECVRFGDGKTIQRLFGGLSLFVTDFSSKAFDAALLEKPVIYYQFDADEFFSGKHASRRGYFDYECDGFGPVLAEEARVLDEIDRITSEGQDPKYLARSRNTFSFRDGRNCERALGAILSLEILPKQ